MPNQLTDLSVEFVSLVDRAAVRDPANPAEPQKFLLWKAESGTPTTPNQGDDPVSDLDDVRAALAKAEQERDEAREATQKAQDDVAQLTDKVTELEKADEPVEPVEIDKAELPEPVRLALEKAESDRVELSKRAEAAEEIAKSERDLRITREFIAKAEKDFPHVGGDANKFGPVLKSMSEKLSKDDYEFLVERLRANDVQLSKSAIFAEMGRGGEPQAGSPQSELVAKRDEIRKADPSLSKSKAMEIAVRDNPDLAGQYANSVR